MPLSAQQPELVAKRPPALIDAHTGPQRSRLAAEPLCGVIFQALHNCDCLVAAGEGASEPLNLRQTHSPSH